MSTFEGRVDPFQLLVDRHVEAKAANVDPDSARKNAIDEAYKTIRSVVNKMAKRYFDGDELVSPDDVAQEASWSLYRECNRIYDGLSEPPHTSWVGYIDRTVRNAGLTIKYKERHHGATGLPGAASFVPWDRVNWVDGDEGEKQHEDATMNQEREDALVRRLSQLRIGVDSGELFCVFHPGRRCPHVSGAPCKRCQHPTEVFDTIDEEIISAPVSITKLAHIKKLLIDRTGYDPKTQGNALRRNGYRCLDWFIYLLLRDFSDGFGEDWSELRRHSRESVAKHLKGEGSPDTTLCILMNDYPDIPIPPELMEKYAPKHLRRTEGEVR